MCLKWIESKSGMRKPSYDCTARCIFIPKDHLGYCAGQEWMLLSMKGESYGGEMMR